MLGLSPAMFNAQLSGMGVTATWQPSTACPCRSSRTGGSNVTCTICGGNRYVWDDPYDVKIGIQALKGQREWAQFGEWQEGDALATIGCDQQAYHAKEYDRFVLNAEYHWSTVLTRGKDTLKHEHIVRIDRIWAIISDVQTELKELVDWQLNGNTITWLTATLPDQQQYSITYTANPEYYVFKDLLQDRPQYGRDLPRKIALRLMDLYSQAVN